MKTNETINEIRKTRKEISRKFNFDPKRLVAFYKLMLRTSKMNYYQ